MSSQETFQPLTEGPFRFHCHKGIACFTQCCARLRLVLTPYDILRMKNRLGIPSWDFLERYTETFLDRHQRFPSVKLKMGPDPEGRCPFVTDEGCSLYEDRPGSCRLYPVGRAWAGIHGGGRQSVEKYFLIRESHCKGFEEHQTWTLHEWMKHEGLQEYHAMNEPWLQILASPHSLGSPSHLEKKQQMFFMASYNLDRFREFVFKSRFLEKFALSDTLSLDLKAHDTALMQFSFEWLQFSLFGQKGPYF